MLFANLKNTLKTEIKPAYTLFGSDIFLINKAIELILEAAKIEPLNVTRLDEGTDESEIEASLRNVSMFGGSTAVIVRGAETRVILEPGIKVKDVERVDCNPMTSDLVVRMILSQKRFTQDAAVLLATCCDNNYASVDNEINKLFNFFKDKELLTADDVASIVTKTENFQIYELSNALLKKDAIRADKILHTLLSCGMEEYAVFGNLVSSVRRLFFALTSPAPDGQVWAYLKGQPYAPAQGSFASAKGSYAVTASRRDGRHLREKIAGIYENALDLEYQIKSGKITAERAIFLLQGLLLT